MSLDLSLNYSQFNFEMNKSRNVNIYEFEDFKLDAAHLLLSRDGQEIALAPKVVETLLALVEKSGAVVGKDELIERVWADTAVEEGNLSQNLFRLRKVLGETPDGKPFIETLRRRGYRFVPPVRVVESAEKVLSSDFARVSGANFVSPSNEKNFADDFARSNEDRAEIKTENGAPKSALENFALDENSHNGFSKNAAQNVSDSSPQASNSRAVLIGAVAALLVAASLGFALRFAFDRQAANGFAELNLKRLTESGDLSGAAISGDGNSLCYVLHADEKYSLRLKNIQTESEIVVVAPT